MNTIRRFLLALWFGGGIFFIAVAAPAAFRIAPDTLTAGNLVGGMLSRWHYLALLAPLVLILMELRAADRPLQGYRSVLLLVALLFAAGESMLDLRIHSMRESSPVPIGSLPKSDPLRRHFGMLHGASWFLLAGQLFCAAAVLATWKDERDPVSPQRTPEPAVAPPPPEPVAEPGEAGEW